MLCELFRQRLDRHLSSELRVSRTPDFTHPSLTKGRNDFIVCAFGAGLDHPYI